MSCRGVPDPDLPGACTERSHLLRDVADGGQDQPTREFRRGVGRAAGMLVGRYDHAPARARVDVDVRVDAPLADELQFVQALEERRPDLGPLADEDQRLGVLQTGGQRVDLLNVVVPDVDLMPVQFPEAGKRFQRIEVVVENRDLHGLSSR